MVPHPQNSYGIAEAGTKKVFFVVTPYVVDSRGSGGGPTSRPNSSSNPYVVDSRGSGGGAILKQKLKSSGVPALPGGQADEIQCVSGDGGSSLGLAYKLEGGTLKVRTAGSKHIKKISIRGNYYINTYLLFSTQKTR